jgi:hypothetical protein
VARGAAPPADGYRWSLGATVGVLGNVNVGRNVENGVIDGEEVYGPGGADLRLLANFILGGSGRLGLQGSIGIGALSPGKDSFEDDGLLIADFGGALFYHLPVARRLFLTPLAGPFLSVQRPQELSNGFLAGGMRAELGLSYVFGRGGEHAFSVAPAVNVYFPSSRDVEGAPPEVYGFDVTHATFGVAFGYTHRFATPFGTVPIITLE